NIRADFPAISYLDDMPVLFEQAGDYDIPFDLFAAVFYWLTEYEFYITGRYDLHGRYDEEKYPSFKQALHERALVHEYAELLWNKLVDKNASLSRELSVFEWEVTFDVDHPWAFKHKGIINVFGSLADLFRFDLPKLKLRWKSIAGFKDPYDHFEDIFRRVPKEKLKFFFLINRENKLDGRYTFRNKHYQQLIRLVKEKSAEIGIHPSYTSFLSKQAIEMEKSELEEITGKKIYSVRQHYLRYRNDKTRTFYEQLGLTHDYNACLINGTGFRNGMGIPFPWFNLEKNEMTKLIIHPVMVMDVSLKDYLGLTTDAALIKIKGIINECKKYNLKFVLLWHNSSLSEIEGWEGWNELFEETIDYLKMKE
nr:polysaccharide deacetylase family protein [Bacteroidota bacterium]